MSETTGISWCHHTFNIAWGCNEVSAGCDRCYARTLAERYGYQVWGAPHATHRRLFGDAHWREPLRWNAAAAKAGERRRVFCSSMADVFEVHSDLDRPRERLWDLIDATPYLDWLLLTKRPEQISRMLPQVWQTHPCSNIWLGTSVEDQAAADLRIPRLLSVPAVVHWLSMEPLLGPVDLWSPRYTLPSHFGSAFDWGKGVSWVVVGGESGAGFRPMDLDWVRLIREDCRAADCAFFYKQGASRLPGRDTMLDGQEWHEWPATDASRQAVPS